jgi:AcrR family transcriptional regulator
MLSHMSAQALGAATDLRTRRRNETRLEIQQAALTLFEEQGFEMTTVDEIARAAGISSRTFFRYFATKEESVLFDMYGFDDALRTCVADADPAHFSLADVESAFRSVIESLGHSQNELASTILRIQRLVSTNPSLSKAALGRCAESSQQLLTLVDDNQTIKARTEIRMMLEIAQLALQCAFDRWVNTGAPSSPDDDLLACYQDVCVRVRQL